MLNQFMVIGRISKLHKNDEITEISVSVPRNYKNTDGVYENDIINCVLLKEIAERTLEYCSVGNMVGIKGTIESDGENNILKAEKVTFLSQSK